MIIRFRLNTMEFECEFSDVCEMIEFFRNLRRHNRRKVKFIEFVIIKEN
jgi:hypothetical protein